MKTFLLYVASGNIMKRRAVEHAFYESESRKRFWTLPPIENIIMIKCGEHIPKQPLGLGNIRRACEERIQYVLQQVKDPKAVIIAIQNGIIGEEGYYYDTDKVMIRNCDDVRRCSLSTGIPIPSSFIKTLEAHQYRTTFGTTHAMHFKQGDPGNVHREIVGIDRLKLIAMTIEVVIGLFLNEKLNIFEP